MLQTIYTDFFFFFAHNVRRDINLDKFGGRLKRELSSNAIYEREVNEEKDIGRAVILLEKRDLEEKKVEKVV